MCIRDSKWVESQMTYCGTLAEPITRRVAEGMNLDDIANEMCTSVKDPRQKLIRIIKELLGEDYLIENAEVLEYDVGKAKLGRIPKQQTLREIKTEGDSVSKVSSCKASVSKPSEKSCASKVSERKPSSKISACESEKVKSPTKEPIAYSSP